MVYEYVFQLTKESLFTGLFETLLDIHNQDCDWNMIYKEMKAYAIDVLAKMVVGA